MTDVVFYTEGAVPTEAEKKAIGELLRRSLAVRVRSEKHWRGDVERCDAVVTRRPEIGRAYEAAGIGVLRENGESEISGPQRVLDDKIYALLVEAGFETATQIADATDEEILSISGIGPASLREIRQVYPWSR